MQGPVQAACPTTMPGVFSPGAIGAHCNCSTSPRQGMARKSDTFDVPRSSTRTSLMAALSVLLPLTLGATAAAGIPTSDNPNSVVQIDFSRQFDKIDVPQCARKDIVHVTLADQEVACLLPRRKSSGIQLLDGLEQFLSATPDADSEATQLLGHSAGGVPEPKDCQQPTRLSNELHVGSPELQSYMRAARLRWLLDRCFRFSDVGVRDWRYELCVGRKVTLFKGNALTGKTIGKSLFELGTYAPSMDQLWADGTMTQWYTGGTEGRQTEVTFVCGDTHPRVKGILGPEGGKYHVWLEAPMFCDYRENAADPALNEFLLRSLEGWCSTFTTDGWWSYEYCHPDSLIQYHKEPNGEVKGPMYLLGTLHASGDAAEMIFKKPNPTNPTLRGTDTLPPKANGQPRFKFLPVQIVDRPLQITKNPAPASNKVLALQLTNIGSFEWSPTRLRLVLYTRRPARFLAGAASYFPADNAFREYILAPKLDLTGQPAGGSGDGLLMQAGTICEGTDKQRSARVLFECPVDFPLLATHRIVHIEETSFCSYDLVIQTPLVCPHPKLQPPRPLDPQEILSYPTGRTFVHGITPASWKDLSIAEPPPTEAEEAVTNQRLSAHLEAVPEKALRLFQEGGNVGAYGLSLYVRKRTSVKEPRFKIGEIVRHRWWQYNAVVLSWDTTCMAEDAWTNKVYDVYPRDVYSRPHYLVLVDTPSDSTSDRPLYAYVPEAGLEAPLGDLREITHPALHEHFKHYFMEARRYVVNQNALAKSFPDDTAL